MASSPIEVSVVVPCKNEQDNIGPLIDEVAAALAGRRFEIVVVDDASTDGTTDATARAAKVHEGIRLVRHDRSAGQSAAVRTGLEAARGEVVVTIDGDGQNDPAYIPALLAALQAGEPAVALAAGQRVRRKAGFAKRYGSLIANAVRRSLLKDDTRDTGCGLKALRRTTFLRLPYFDGWHRFLPALVRREGFQTAAVEVLDRPRRHGTSNYGIFDRLWIGIADMIGVWWLLRRRAVVPAVREDGQE